MLDAVGVITTGRVGFTETFRNIFQITGSLPLKHGMQANTTPYWEQGLTAVVQDALETGAKYILFFDGDGVFTEQQVADLYRIIESDDKCDAVFPIQADRFGPVPLVHNWLPEAFGPYDYDQPTIRYPHGHFGCTFIRSDVFRNLPMPWFWSQPNKDGSWRLGDNKMDADTYFWLKLKQEYHDRTGRYCLQANQTVIGHMELHIRWQVGPNVVIQTVPEYRRNGPPYGLRAPRPDEYQKGERPSAAPEPLPGTAEADRVAMQLAQIQANLESGS